MLGIFVILICVVTLGSEITSVSAASKLSPIVNITAGSLQGSEGESRNGFAFYQFLGIPFGFVPQRFMESQPAKPWEGVKDATDFGWTCKQIGLGIEDCLVLNVYTPTLPSESPAAKLPVLVSIHGGQFILGTSRVFGPKYFMDENVVLVTIQYRLNALGFLNLGIDEAPGNQGLKDQVLALKWVQENIGFFGGDKNRVTIFGESAGGASVSYLLLSPLSRGLFSSAISQSGTALCPWAFNPYGENDSVELAKNLNCKGTRKEMLNCLVKLDVNDIIAAMMPNANAFVPSVESREPSTKSTIFLPNKPIDMFKQGHSQKVPYILGVTASEGYAFTRAIDARYLASGNEGFIAGALNYWDHKNSSSITRKIQKYYLKGKSENLQKNLTDCASDRMWNYCTELAAKFHARVGKTYLYIFNKSGGFSLMSSIFILGSNPTVPTHADDLTYHFDMHILPIIATSDIGRHDKGYNFSTNFVKMWTEFASTGAPMSQWNSQDIQWKPVLPSEINEYKRLNFDDRVDLRESGRNYVERMEFWEELNLYGENESWDWRVGSRCISKFIKWDPIDPKIPDDHKWLHMNDNNTAILDEDSDLKSRMKF